MPGNSSIESTPARACYTSICESVENTRKIEIFTKVGSSMRYKQCLPVVTKKSAVCVKSKKNIIK